MLLVTHFAHAYGVILDRANGMVRAALALPCFVSLLLPLPVPFPALLPRYVPSPLLLRLPLPVRGRQHSLDSIHHFDRLRSSTVSLMSTSVDWRLPPRRQPSLLAAVTAQRLFRRLVLTADHPEWRFFPVGVIPRRFVFVGFLPVTVRNPWVSNRVVIISQSSRPHTTHVRLIQRNCCERSLCARLQ